MQKQIIHQSSWAKSAAGKPIELFRKTHNSQTLSQNPELTTVKPFIFIGGVHGDEPEGVRLAEELNKWLHSLSSTKLEKLHNWILIPCLNVDGYSSNTRTNSRGVDLNRNFPSKDWSPEAKSERYYPGPHANSEPETQALVKLIEVEQPKAIIHFHSWEPCVVYTGSTGREYAKILAHELPYPVREDIGYPTPGSLGQYAWLNYQIPVICLEEQEKSDLNLVWPHFSHGLKKLLLPE